MFVLLLASVVTLILGGGLGYALSGKIAAPKRVWGLLAWGFAVLLAASIGQGTSLVSIFGFTIYLNYFLMSLVLGAFLGLLARHR